MLVRFVRRSVLLGRLEPESFYFFGGFAQFDLKCRIQSAAAFDAGDWRRLGWRVVWIRKKVWLYRQSDVPEITELMWSLACVAGKGILNRAHAYKAVVDKNRSHGDDDDAGITAGLFMYPVLMAADILLFNAHQCPGGTRSDSAYRDGAGFRAAF